jgi:hypothetical protein
VSFLDEPDEPVRRPRRRSAGGPTVDRQTLMVRRTIAAGAGLVVLILLVLGVRGCLNARQERAIEDYVTDARALSQESTQQGSDLFGLLQGPGGQEQVVDIQNALNGLRVQSAQLVDRAGDLDVPGDLSTAQRYFLDSLELRRDGLAEVADAIPSALGDQERRQGTDRVAEMMQVFLASDVVYTARFRPSLADTLDSEEISLQPPRSEFVPDIEWLDPSFVADQVSGIRTGEGGDQAAAPGLHGNGLGTVTLGGVALTPGASATVQLSSDLGFEVQVVNQGENTENDVNVRVRVGQGDDAVDLEEPIDTIAAGEAQTVTIPLDRQPPTGQNVPIEVEIEPVPGEEKTDNNSATYSVIFTR